MILFLDILTDKRTWYEAFFYFIRKQQTTYAKNVLFMENCLKSSDGIRLHYIETFL